MLRALKEQLKVLALDEDSKFHDVLRKRVGKKATELFEDRIKQFIMLMPDLVERIYFYYGNLQDDNSRTKKLGSYVLTYLYHPDDLISEDWGMFGYLDDAYFGAVVFEKIIAEVPRRHQLLVEPDKTFNETIRHLKASARSVIPEEALRIDHMIADILKGDEVRFIGMFR